ncbi:MAG: hypothetical protein KJ000_05505, partial [Pirellulaceae bacterium]|nr:hypothetical protein [Pirellulaceae bacterium]
MTTDGTTYRQFILEANQTGAGPNISLDRLEVYLSASGGLNQYPFDDGTGPTATKIYDLDAGENNWIILNAGLAAGGAQADMVFYLPQTLVAGFPADTFVTLFSRFGDNASANDGFEQWGILQSDDAIFSGYKWHDSNADGVWDEGEPGLNGWTIEVYDAQGDLVTSTQTNDDGLGEPGYYEFSLPPGEYTFQEVLLQDWYQSFPADPGTYTETLVSGEAYENNNFGNYQYATKSGYKWHDLNADGVWDEGEPGLNGWTIE